MQNLLFIECSTRTCSVALAIDGKVEANKSIADTQSHAKVLQLLIQDVLKEAGISFKSLNAVALGAGPGSYTGLRIAMSAAKGLCYALDLPFIAMDTLEALALEGIKKNEAASGYYIACMNSRKGEIYLMVLNDKEEVLEVSQPALVTSDLFDKYKNKQIYILGNAEDKIKNIIFERQPIYLNLDFVAKNYVKKGFERLKGNQFDNLTYYEPNYLKPFFN